VVRAPKSRGIADAPVGAFFFVRHAEKLASPFTPVLDLICEKFLTNTGIYEKQSTKLQRFEILDIRGYEDNGNPLNSTRM
jgi:hypothetical protein